MKKFLAYFLGGLVCLGAGAGGFIVAEAYYRPSAPPAIFAARALTSDSINNLLPLVADRLNDDSSKAQVETSGFLGADASTIAPRNDGGDKEAGGKTILFMGDIMLDRAVEAKIAKNGIDHVFAKIKDTVSAASYSIANLEGPITTINNSPENDMRFSFAPALAAELAAAGFDAFSLANNHGLDQGSAGLADTKKNLTTSNLGYFGDPLASDDTVLRFTTGYVRFAVIGLHDLFKKIDPAKVAEQIKEAKKDSDFIIVYPHWGEEYQHKQNARQVALAHAFIDAGADLVVGSHPHVVQGIEKYKGKMIFYSLGNLVFDQYFSVDTQKGLAVSLTTFPAVAGNVVELLPYEIPQSQPVFVDGDKKAKMLSDLASWSAPELKDQIIAGNIQF